MSKKAFQAVLESFERLANPEKFEEEDGDDDGKPAKKRQKTERFTRGNQYIINFSNFFCMFLNLNYFFQLES